MDSALNERPVLGRSEPAANVRVRGVCRRDVTLEREGSPISLSGIRELCAAKCCQAVQTIRMR